MNRLRLVSLICFVIIVGQSVAQGQSELDRVADKIKSVIEASEPGWQCVRGQPMASPTESPRLLIEACSLYSEVPITRASTKRVRVRYISFDITPHQSAEEARRLLHDFVTGRAQQVKEQPNLGDEAYFWGMDNTHIVMVKGRFTIFIRALAHTEYDADAKSLSYDQKNARSKAERLRLTPQFARHVATALGSF